MSKDSWDEKDSAKTSQMQDVRSELQNLRNDLQDVKSTWEGDKPNAKRTTKHTFSKHKNKLVLLAALLIPAYFYFDVEVPTIPEWVIVVGVGILAGCVVGFIPAKYVVDRFVTDTRKPIFEIDPVDVHDVHLYNVPQERIPDIEVLEGDKNRIETTKGTGYEVEKFVQVEEEGKEHLIAKGTWVGEKSGLELKRDIMNIAGMKKTMKPYAMKGFAYDVMWPHIMRELQSTVGNQMARSFENVAIFKGDGLRSEIDNLIEEYQPDNIIDRVDESDIDQSEHLENGDEDIDKDALRKMIN